MFYGFWKAACWSNDTCIVGVCIWCLHLNPGFLLWTHDLSPIGLDQVAIISDYPGSIYANIVNKYRNKLTEGANFVNGYMPIHLLQCQINAAFVVAPNKMYDVVQCCSKQNIWRSSEKSNSLCTAQINLHFGKLYAVCIVNFLTLLWIMEFLIADLVNVLYH